MATKPEIPFLILISGGTKEALGAFIVHFGVCVGVCCESAFNLCTGGQHFRHSHRIDMETRLTSTAKVLWHFGLQSVQSIHPTIYPSVELSNCRAAIQLSCSLFLLWAWSIQMRTSIQITHFVLTFCSAIRNFINSTKVVTSSPFLLIFSLLPLSPKFT